MNRAASDTLSREMVCPFCGLCCDDLTLRTGDDGNPVVVENGCARAVEGFAGSPPADDASAAGPCIDGNPCTLDAAVDRAAALMAGARQPLFGGLACDVAGARALVALADRCGALLDHMNSASLLRNLLAVQDGGWLTTTLTEARNRADVVLLFGPDIDHHAPRLHARVLGVATTLFSAAPLQRHVIAIGGRYEPASADTALVTDSLDCPAERLGEVAMTMRALLRGARVAADAVAGIPVARLRDVVERLRAARYGVVAWAAAGLAFEHAELAVQAFCELAVALNAHTRCAALPLGGDNADHTFAQVATWLAGFPTRAGFAHGRPAFEPLAYATATLTASGATDALLWVSAFDARRVPPPCAAPTLVLGRSGMRFERPPAVYIPVATPGLDHAGHVYRCDAATALPLRALRRSPLPRVAEVAHALLERLPDEAGRPC